MLMMFVLQFARVLNCNTAILPEIGMMSTMYFSIFVDDEAYSPCRIVICFVAELKFVFNSCFFVVSSDIRFRDCHDFYFMFLNIFFVCSLFPALFIPAMFHAANFHFCFASVFGFLCCW